MNPKVRTMLEQMYDLLFDKFQEPSKAWDNLVEFIAVDNCPIILFELNHNFEWLFKDSNLVKMIREVYQPKLIRSDYYDHLGEMYFEKNLSQEGVHKNRKVLTPMNIADKLTQMTTEQTNIPIKILDPAVGTGRCLMAAYKKAPQAMLFGVDGDLRVLRIALTNFMIHNIPGYLLHADRLLHETDICKQDGKYNWEYANRWHSAMGKLKKKATNSNLNLNLEYPLNK